MSRRVFSSLLFATVALGSITAPVLVSAQDTGSTITVYFATCTWTGSLPGLVFDTDAGLSETARDCVDGWTVEGVNLLLNDAPPDSQDSNAAVWNYVADGESILLGYGNIPAEEVQGFNVSGEDVTIWATYYDFERVPESGSSTTPTTSTGVTTAAEITALPNTGSGVAKQSNSVLGTFMAAVVMMIGAVGALSRQRLTK